MRPMEPRPDADPRPRGGGILTGDPIPIIAAVLGLAGVLGGASLPVLVWAVAAMFGGSAVVLGIVGWFRNPATPALSVVGTALGALALAIAIYAAGKSPLT